MGESRGRTSGIEAKREVGGCGACAVGRADSGDTLTLCTLQI